MGDWQIPFVVGGANVIKPSVQLKIADRAEHIYLQAVVNEGVSSLLRINNFDDISKGFSKGFSKGGTTGLAALLSALRGRTERPPGAGCLMTHKLADRHFRTSIDKPLPDMVLDDQDLLDGCLMPGPPSAFREHR